MLQNPSVLFADEPTTGLDATSAHHVVKTLKNLAKRGRTVITTIHQPRSEIWDLFDRVILLAHGCCVYSGEAKYCIPYFESLGHKLPLFVNPSEFLIDLVAIDNRSPDKEATSSLRLGILRQAWNDRHQAASTIQHVKRLPINTQPPPKVSTLRQINVLTGRNMVVFLRNPKELLMPIMEAAIIGLVLGWIFFQLDDNLQGIRSRQGAFFAATAIPGLLVVIYEIHRLSVDIEVFDREHSEGVVNVLSFLVARRLSKAVEDVPVSVVTLGFETRLLRNALNWV
jgi:hypothetical protein